MENKARYTIVGLFLIVFSIAMVVFVLWQARFSLDEKKYYEYRIYSQTSIAGLKENSFVEYKGLVIGTVEKIAINAKNIEQIEIVLKINEPDVIKEDSFALIASQGITGNKNIEIDGGSLNSKSLIPNDGEFVTIPLKASFFDTLTKDAGDITANMNKTLVNVNKLLNQQNINNITQMLSNLKDGSENINKTIEKLDKVLTGVDKLVSTNLTTTVDSIDVTAQEWSNLAKELQVLIDQDIKNLLTNVNDKLDDVEGVDKVIFNINNTLEKLGSTLDNINTNGGDMLFKTRDVHYGPQESLNE